MKKLLVFTFTGTMFFVGSCSSNTEKPGANKTSPTPTQQSGTDIYTNKCVACHGADGNMGIAGAKKLPESVLTQEEREQIISNGKGTMPAFKEQLSPVDIKAVAEYTLTLK